MQILELNDETKKDITAVLAYAKDHPIPYEDMLLIADNEKKSPAGFDPGYVCFIKHGYRIVFTIEEQPCGWCKHISVSAEGKEAPSVEATQVIIKEFGFDPIEESLNVWMEEGFGPLGEKFHAANIIQLVEKE